MSNTRSTDAAAEAPPPALTDHEAMVRTAAYFRYLNNGCRDGHEAEDWFAAEQELRLRAAEPSAVAAAVVTPAPESPVRAQAEPRAKSTAKPAPPAKAAARTRARPPAGRGG